MLIFALAPFSHGIISASEKKVEIDYIVTRLLGPRYDIILLSLVISYTDGDKMILENSKENIRAEISRLLNKRDLISVKTRFEDNYLHEEIRRIVVDYLEHICPKKFENIRIQIPLFFPVPGKP